MSNMTIMEQRDVVLRYQHEHGAPVMVDSLCNFFGVELLENRGLEPYVSGLIVRTKDENSAEKYQIHMNSNHSYMRRRFTAAHELAHFILHKDKIGDGVSDNILYRSNILSSKVEDEANAYAADILMPYFLIAKELRKNPLSEECGIEKMADIFQVSTAAMSIRLGVPT